MRIDDDAAEPVADASAAAFATLRALVDSEATPSVVLAHAAEALGVATARLEAVVSLIAASGIRSASSDLQRVLDPGASDQDRALSLRHLGFRQDGLATVIALLGPAEGVDAVLTQLRTDAVVQHAEFDGVHAVLTSSSPTGIESLRVAAGVRGGYLCGSPALALPESWRHARNALRFALPSPRDDTEVSGTSSVLVDAAQLGPYEILAEQLSVNQMARIPDVERLDELLRLAGPDMHDTLLAVAATDSVREAARRLHMHHNSVAHRVERAQRAFDFSLTEPYGRARLLLILTLHRLVASNTLF